MKNCKKLIALCLALATVFSFTVFASAAGTDISASGDSASASVNLSSTVDGSLTGDPAATAMSVTVPTVLPIAVGTDGTVTTATDAKIVNNSYGAVRVASVTLEAAGGEAFPVYSDVSTAEGCKKLVDAAVERWGRLDIVVSNAAATWTGNFKGMTLQNWETCVRSKLDQAFYLMHYAVPEMRKHNYGRIIMASSEAHVGLEGMCGYSAACGGITAFARAVSQDLAEDGITVNAYTPNAGTRSWFNMLAEYREEGYDTEAIEEGSPAAQKFPPDRMIGILGFMCLPEFTASGLVVSVCADGQVSLWDNYTKYNTIYKDLWADGAWTVEEIRAKLPDLLHKVFYTRTTLAVTKSEYDI